MYCRCIKCQARCQAHREAVMVGEEPGSRTFAPLESRGSVWEEARRVPSASWQPACWGRQGGEPLLKITQKETEVLSKERNDSKQPGKPALVANDHPFHINNVPTPEPELGLKGSKNKHSPRGLCVLLRRRCSRLLADWCLSGADISGVNHFSQCALK